MAQSQPTQDEKDRLLWEDVRGQLDGALHELSEPLRQAVVLRCLLQQTPEDCARSAGVSEKAFSMRLSRGLDALREKLTRRGVTLGSVLLADLIARHAVLSAPQTLQHALVATALGKAAATPPALFTAKGVVYAMFWTKAKTALIAVLVLLFVTGGTAIAYRCAVPAPVVPALKAATPPPAATVQPAAPAASQSAKVDLADVPRLNREPGQKAADGPVTKLAPEADQARERACEQISKVMGKQDVDWAIAKPLDPRLPANLRKRAYVGLPGNLQTVTVHPDHRYWITAIGIDLKDPSKSIWWEFEVNPDSVTERIRAPLAKLAAPAGDVRPAEQTEAKEF